MKFLFLNADQVRRLLTVRECIDVMDEAFRDLALGKFLLPLRQVVMMQDRSGLLGLMPAMNETSERMSAKVISVFPQNRREGLESHQGVVLLFETAQGKLLSIADAGSITAIRTAAVSGVATKILSRTDAGDLAILGSGVQAGAHLEAMLAVRNIRSVRIWSRNRENAESFAQTESARHHVPIQAVSTPREAVDQADIVCTVTASTTPVLEGSWLAAGAHINAVGRAHPTRGNWLPTRLPQRGFLSTPASPS